MTATMLHQPQSIATYLVNTISSVMSLLIRVMSHPAAWLIWVMPLVIAGPLNAQITVTELQSPYSFVNDPIETVERVARAYDTRWLVLDGEDSVKAAAPILDDMARPAWLGEPIVLRDDPSPLVILPVVPAS